MRATIVETEFGYGIAVHGYCECPGRAVSLELNGSCGLSPYRMRTVLTAASINWWIAEGCDLTEAIRRSNDLCHPDRVHIRKAYNHSGHVIYNCDKVTV